MKTLHNYIILLAVMLLLVSCTTTKSISNKKDDYFNLTSEERAQKWEEKEEWSKTSERWKDMRAWHNKYKLNENDSLTADIIYDLMDSTSAMRQELDSIIRSWGMNPDSLANDSKTEYSNSFRAIDSLLNVDISPNPTSSSVTLKFFTNLGANRYELFPQDITVDLYYLHQKVHSFDFSNSYGEETIPEQYLQKDGSYRIIYNGNSTPFVVKKN